jgi:hypothetical protein
MGFHYLCTRDSNKLIYHASILPGKTVGKALSDGKQIKQPPHEENNRQSHDRRVFE